MSHVPTFGGRLSHWVRKWPVPPEDDGSHILDLVHEHKVMSPGSRHDAQSACRWAMLGEIKT